MVKDISPGDRVARVVFGIAMLSVVFDNPQSFWFYLGIILWATDLAGWCPLYALLDIAPGKSCKYSLSPGGHL